MCRYKVRLPIVLILNAAVGSVYAVDNFYDMQLGDSGISLSPGIEVIEKYDDNIFLQESGRRKKSSWITEINPYLSFNTHRGLDAYEFRYTLNAGIYHSSHDDDYYDNIFELNTHTEFDKRNRLDFSASYARLHENRGTGISDGLSIFFDSPNKYTDTILDATYTYGTMGALMNLELAASYLDKEYTNHREVTRYFDYSAPKYGATFYYRVMPKTRLLFEATYEDIDYDNDRPSRDNVSSDEYNYLIGATWDATAKTTGIVKLGYLSKDFDSSYYKDDDFMSWEVAVNWHPREKTQFNFVSSSDAVESNGTGTFNEVQNYVASWDQAWSSKVSSTVTLSRLDTDYKQSSRDDTTRSIGFGVDYEFSPEIIFGTSYDYTDRDSSTSGNDYEENVFMIYARVGI